MSVVVEIFLAIHFIGLAAVIGAFLVQARRKEHFDTFWVIAGLLTQLVSGLVMMGVLSASEPSHVNNVKLGVKLVIAIVALVLAFVARSRQRRADVGDAKPRAALPFFHTAGALAIVNVVIAVFWN